MWRSSAIAAGAEGAPVKGGTLVYLEQQPHTNLYPPAGGFYPNGGILNQITDKLTYQNPKTLEIEPWIAESWTVNADATEYTFKIRKGVTFSDGTPLDAAAVAKNYDTFGRGNKELKLPISEVINNYDRSEVIDPQTVKFYLQEAVARLSAGHIGDRLRPRVAEDPRTALRGAGRRHEDHRLGSLRRRKRNARTRAHAESALRLHVGAGEARAPGPRLSRRDQIHRHAGRQRAHRRPGRRAGRRHSPDPGL